MRFSSSRAPGLAAAGLVTLCGAFVVAACGADASSSGIHTPDASPDAAASGGRASGSGGSANGTGGSKNGTGGSGTGSGGTDADIDASLDGGQAVDASSDGSAGSDASDGSSNCSFGTAANLATDQSLDLFGGIVYFGGGAELPAGRYRVTYVDGCMKYANSGQDWTIHAYADGHDAWWLGTASGDQLIMPPGTVGYVAANGAFTDFADCVAANQALPPVEFDFAGGKLGVWLLDSPVQDNAAGEDGRNPRWKLERLGGCTSVDAGDGG